MFKGTPDNLKDYDLPSELPDAVLDLEKVKHSIPSFHSQKLCEMIICDRYFGCYKEIGIMCMQELAKRRELGDTFLFEDAIEQGYKQLPELNLNTINVREILQQAIKRKV
jgi:hypothetical protein